MRQRNGAELFGANDPRSTSIGIIDVAPEDDRQSILTAILTQDKLGRKETVLVMPQRSSAFRRVADFKEFENALPELQTKIVFVVPGSPGFAKAARQRHYPVFLSLEKYAQYAQTFLYNEPAEATSETAEEQSPVLATEAASADVIPAPITPPPPAIEEEPTRPIPQPETTPSVSQVPEPLPTTSEPSPSASSVDEETEDRHAAATPEGTLDQEQPQRAAPPPSRPKEQIAFPTPPSSGQPRPFPVSPTPAPLPSPIPRRRSARPVPPSQAPTAPTPATPPVPSPASPPPSTSRGIRVALPSRRRLWLIAVLVAFVLALIGCALGVSGGVIPLTQIFPGLSSATITITPDSKDLKNTYPIVAVPTLPDALQQQIQARVLSSTSQEQKKTVKASGTGNTPATRAQGILIFYNALAEEQTIPAGTVFTDANGVKVVNDEAITIPTAHPPTESLVTTTAHALDAGAHGNIAAFDFRTTPCCHPGITVENSGAFQGGQDRQAYTYVQQNDIDTAANALKPALLQAGQRALKAQISPSEQLIDTIQCTPNIVTDHTAGDRTDSVTVSETVTCTGEVYDQRAALALAEDLLKRDSVRNAGTNYTLTGSITTRITQVKKADAQGAILLSVQAEGLWVYHFTNNERTELAKLVAARRTSEAQTLLLQQRGVRQAKIDLFLAVGNTLPGDPHQIAIVFSQHTS